MKALIFDTETTGMVKWKKPPEDPSQPHLIQLGMLLVDTTTWAAMGRHSSLVQLPEGASIEPEAHQAHGISERDCKEFGVALMVACSLFNQACMRADVIVAHNMSFDQTVMLASLYRLGDKPERMSEKRLICTKEESTPVLKLPGKYGDYKWPTLAEAYQYYTGKELVGAHDALVDTEACLEVFRGLIDTGVVKL
jgi:DNA polymerase III epsilon subunit-like protein